MFDASYHLLMVLCKAVTDNTMIFFGDLSIFDCGIEPATLPRAVGHDFKKNSIGTKEHSLPPHAGNVCNEEIADGETK